MTIRPIISTSVASIVLCASILPAFAESSSSSSAAGSSSSIFSVSELDFPTLPGSCESNPDKDRCIPDALKALERAKSEYVNMVARRRQKWIDEHAKMGRTTEYLQLLQAFSEQTKKEGEAFIKKISDQTKIITAGRTNRRGRGASSSSASSVGPKTSVQQKDIDKCASVKDPHKRRLCIRTEANAEKFRPKMGKTYR